MTPIEQVHLATSKCAAVLAGLPPEIQGAVLADLLATFLAGHQCAELREEILRWHIAAVRDLIPVNEEMLASRRRRN